MNDMLRRAIKRAHIPAVKEPPGLLISDGKSRDGATVIPWAKGKLMAWDVTVPDNFKESHQSYTAAEEGAAAKQTAGYNTCRDLKRHTSFS